RRAPADLDRMGVRGRRGRDAEGRARRPRLEGTHPGLVFAALERGAAAGRAAGRQRLGRARPARPGLGVDRRLLVAAGLRRQSLPGRPGRDAVLRRRRDLDGRPRELRGADAGGDAGLAGRRGRDREHGVPMGEECTRRFGTVGAMALGAAMALLPAHAAHAKDAPLPGDSVYQLSLPLTDQAGATYDWRTLRG